MDAFWLDWINLALRWAHVIVGIAWIGTSFFFVWLDHSLERPESDAARDVGGEAWLVHGGGFYRMQKYGRVPGPTLARLHWFKWEAYSTWLTGIALLFVMYYLGAETYLVSAASPVGPLAGVAIGIGFLVGGWLLYDWLCKRAWAVDQVRLALVGFGLLGLAAFALGEVFTGRGAYIHVGAMLGTIMAANVAMVIIPGQRQLVAATAAGGSPDPAVGAKAKQRSLHNNYLTLPVVLIMISNHYPMTYAQQWGWAILLALVLIGALVRHFFNLRHVGRQALWIPPAAAAALLALAFVAQPRVAPSAGTVSFAQVEQVIADHCAACHATVPSYPGFDAPPGGIVLETAADIRRHAQAIYAQAVASEAMPLGNVTEITAAERGVLARWLAEREADGTGR
ncbi:MAG: urate hydroxylase PuuD [Pseudomonadota bacterium]